MFINRRNVHSLEMQMGADTLTLTLTFDLMNPKSMGFDKVSRSRPTTVPSFKSIVLKYAHTYPCTHPHTS